MACDYLTKIVAQLYFGVRYGEALIFPSHLDQPILFFILVSSSVVAFSVLRTLNPAIERYSIMSQCLLYAGVVGNVLDEYLYPGVIKWFLFLNLAEFFQICALINLVIIILITIKKRVKVKQ